MMNTATKKRAKDMPRAVHVLCQEYEHRVQNCSGLDEVARQWQIERGTYCHEIEKEHVCSKGGVSIHPAASL